MTFSALPERDLYRMRLTWAPGAAPALAVNHQTVTHPPMKIDEIKRRARRLGDLGMIVAIAIEPMPPVDPRGRS